jgi:serine O-acetyltransferase
VDAVDRQAAPGLIELLKADYAVLEELGQDTSTLSSRLLMPLRFLVYPSFRAVLLFRLAARPGIANHFWRSLLMALHACEVWPGATIGPGLRLPHPIGITVAQSVVIGKNVTLTQNVTLGADRDFEAQPRVGDRVTILPGAVVAGAITIGNDALIGANTVVREDVDPGGLAVAAGTEIRPARPGSGAEAWSAGG